MGTTIIFKCCNEGDTPEGLNINQLTKIESHTCIGWLDITEDFKYTLCDVKYRFTIKS